MVLTSLLTMEKVATVNANDGAALAGFTAEVEFDVVDNAVV